MSTRRYQLVDSFIYQRQDAAEVRANTPTRPLIDIVKPGLMKKQFTNPAPTREAEPAEESHGITMQQRMVALLETGVDPVAI